MFLNLCNEYIKIFIKTLIIFVVLTITCATLMYFMGMPLFVFQGGTFLDYAINTIKYASMPGLVIAFTAFTILICKKIWKDSQS